MPNLDNPTGNSSSIVTVSVILWKEPDGLPEDVKSSK